MKEIKLYIYKLPESCSKCEYCTLNHTDNYGRPFCLIARMPLCNGDKLKEERGQHKDSLSDFDCPLIDIKIHDRELVEEVCEKINAKALGLWYFVPNEQKEYFEGNRYLLSLKDFSEILDRMRELEGEDD